MIKTSIKKTHTIWGGFVLLETLKWGKHFTLSFCSNRWVVVCCCQFGYLGSVTLLWLSYPGYLASVTWRGEEVEPGAFSICWRLVFCCLFSVFFLVLLWALSLKQDQLCSLFFLLIFLFVFNLTFNHPLVSVCSVSTNTSDQTGRLSMNCWITSFCSSD